MSMTTLAPVGSLVSALLILVIFAAPAWTKANPPDLLSGMRADTTRSPEALVADVEARTTSRILDGVNDAMLYRAVVHAGMQLGWRVASTDDALRVVRFHPNTVDSEVLIIATVRPANSGARLDVTTLHTDADGGHRNLHRQTRAGLVAMTMHLFE